MAPNRRIPAGHGDGLAVSAPGDALEREAEGVAQEVARGQTASASAEETGGDTQRQGAMSSRERLGLAAATWATATTLDVFQRTGVVSAGAASPAVQAPAARDTTVMTGLWDVVSDGASSAWNTVTDTAEGAWDTVTELGADALLALIRAVSPGLADLIENGPAGIIQETIVGAVSGWLGGLFGDIASGDVLGQLGASLGGVLGVLQAAAAGDPGCCETFKGWMEGLTVLVTDFIHHPVLEAMRDLFSTVNGILFDAWKLVVAPQFDALAAILGGAWDAVTGMVDVIGGWIDAARNVADGAWALISDALGIDDSSEGGLWAMITETATTIWDSIKQTLEPVMGPLETVAGLLLAFSPLGPIFFLVEVVPQVAWAVTWLSDHWGEDDIVEQADEVGGSILPGLARAVTGFGDAISGAGNWLQDSLTELGTAVLQLASAVTGVPLLSMAAGFLQSVSTMVDGLVVWAGEQLAAAAEWVTGTAADIWAYVEPICEVLCSLALCAVNPAMIPMVLAGTAWRLIPDCYKGPIIDFLLDVVIEMLEAAPDLVMFGPLWVALKPGVIGFLRSFRGQDTEVKVAVSNKFARILSGSSLGFIAGFVVGFVRGVWEGLTDPFVMAYMLVTGLVDLAQWLHALSAGPGSAPEGQQAQQFWPAVEAFFAGDGSMGFDGLVAKFQEVWPAIQNAIQGAGAALAQEMCAWFMRDDAEYAIGDGIGWLAGTIAFELVLLYFTAGAGTALVEGSRALKYFLKALDWTGEALGAAFKLIGKVGGWIMDLVRALGRLAGSAASGPLHADGTGRRADDSLDMSEKLRVAAEAKLVSDALEATGMPARAIAESLEASFKPRYRWIQRFEVESRGLLATIFMIASKIKIDDVDLRRQGAEDLPANRARLEQTRTEMDELEGELYARLDDSGADLDAIEDALREIQERRERIDNHLRVDPNDRYRRPEDWQSGELAQREAKQDHIARGEADEIAAWEARKQEWERTLLTNERRLDDAFWARIEGARAPDEIAGARRELEEIRNEIAGSRRANRGDLLSDIDERLGKLEHRQHLHDAQARVPRGGYTDEGLIAEIRGGQSNVFANDRDQALRVSNQLEAQCRAADTSFEPRNFHGPESHRGSATSRDGRNTAPDDLHLNVEGVLDGTHFEAHIYYPADR